MGGDRKRRKISSPILLPHSSAPTSSISALRARFIPIFSSSQPTAEGDSKGKMKTEMDVDQQDEVYDSDGEPVPEGREVGEHDQIMDEEHHASSALKPTPAAAAANFPPTPTSDSTPIQRPSIQPPSTSRTDVKPIILPDNLLSSDDSTPQPKAEEKPDIKPDISSSPTSKKVRTKEEIEAQRMAAIERRQAQEKALAVQKKKAETEKRFRQAQATLDRYGLVQIKKEPITVYGTGSGGSVPDPWDPNTPPPAPEVWQASEKCSEEQLEVLKAVENGENVVYTGSAGVGKSFLMTEITRLLEHKKRRFQVTATTGIAALQVNGSTVHSWAGIGLGKEGLFTLYDRISKSKDKRKNWVETQTLFIDEISMMEPELFTKMNLLGKLLRDNNKPFGGMQVVLTGDFFQLPPVPNKDAKCICCNLEHLIKIPPSQSTLAFEDTPEGLDQTEIFKCSPHTRNGQREEGCGTEVRRHRFAFQTESWRECRFRIMELTKVFRQDEPEFVSMLEKFRRGICDEACEETLSQCGGNLQKEVKILPTNLFPHRADVDQLNNQEFNKLKEDIHTFHSRDSSEGKYAETQMERRLKDTPAGKSLRFKVGCQVILLANLNLSQGFVNGSRGIIVDWLPANLAPDDLPAGTHQIDAKKGRQGGGMGSEKWLKDESDAFLANQKEMLLPLVYFSGGKTVIVRPHSWVHAIDKNNMISRTQLPLGLAWALSIHKSQGQTLDAVSVTLNKTFENGQAYVALSRCKTLQGMKVQGFSSKVVRADPAVTDFYKRLSAGTLNSEPTPTINPLSYFPNEVPIATYRRYLFGPLPEPYPIGTAAGPDHLDGTTPAIIVAMEKEQESTPVAFRSEVAPPPIVSPFPTAGHFQSFPLPPPTRIPTSPSRLQRATSAASTSAQSWTDLLRQAADAFVSHQSLNGREATVSLFANQARQLVAASLSSASLAASTSAAIIKEEVDHVMTRTESLSTESYASDIGTGAESGPGDMIDVDEGEGDVKPAKKKKKRSKRKPRS